MEDKILTQSRKDFDAFVGIQHFTIHNPRITKDGYFKAIVYDKYDFEYRKTYNLVLIILFIATIFPIIFGFSDEFIKVGDFIISQTLLFFILPVYFLIYLTSLIEKIKKNWLSRL